VAQCVEDSRLLLDAADRHDYIRGVIVRCGGAAELDEFARHAKFAGVVGQGIELAELAMRGVPVDLAMTAEDTLAAVERHANLHAVLVHLGLPDGRSSWFRAIERLAQSPGIFVKASGLITQFQRPWNAARCRPFVQHALQCFGPARLMFGSDWPATLPDSIWKETLAAFTQSIGAQTMDAREEMLGGAAARFYRIADL